MVPQPHKHLRREQRPLGNAGTDTGPKIPPNQFHSAVDIRDRQPKASPQQPPVQPRVPGAKCRVRTLHPQTCDQANVLPAPPQPLQILHGKLPIRVHVREPRRRTSVQSGTQGGPVATVPRMLDHGKFRKRPPELFQDGAGVVTRPVVHRDNPALRKRFPQPGAGLLHGGFNHVGFIVNRQNQHKGCRNPAHQDRLHCSSA